MSDHDWIEESAAKVAGHVPIVTAPVQDLVVAALRGILTEKRLTKNEAAKEAARLVEAMTPTGAVVPEAQ